MRIQRSFSPKTPAALVALAALVLPGLAGAGEPKEVGHVATLHGDVVAERPGEAPRPLKCRDPIYEGDRIVTGADARVGLLVGELLTHVAQDSVVSVSEERRAADLTLERGAVRVIDPRYDGGQARLALLEADARIIGNDLEAYVLDEKTGGFAMFCEWDAPLEVGRGPESRTAEPGECVIAKPLEPLYSAEAHEERLGSPEDDLCPLGPMFGALELLSPSDVAAAPPLDPWSAIPSFSDLPRRSPCDVPGSGCRSAFEPIAGGGEVPGGSGTFSGF